MQVLGKFTVPASKVLARNHRLIKGQTRSKSAGLQVS